MKFHVDTLTFIKKYMLEIQCGRNFISEFRQSHQLSSISDISEESYMQNDTIHNSEKVSNEGKENFSIQLT